MTGRIAQQHRFAALAGAMLLLCLLAALLRFEGLARRPMHTDEAVHAFRLAELVESGVYEYDPADYHGPTLYYATLPVLWLCGVDALGEMTEVQLRIVPALFGVALVLLTAAVAGGIGARAALMAGLLTAVSPALVFYSRDYIQETLLVVFTMAAIAAAWRYASTRRWWWAVVGGMALGLMHATKETAILAWAAMAGAWFLASGWARWRDMPTGARPLGTPMPLSLLAGALAAGMLLSATLVSVLLRYPRAIVDSWLTYAHYFERSGGAGLHNQPWYYYIKMVLFTQNAPGPWWSEAAIVFFAVIGIAVTLRARNSTPEHARQVFLQRFLAFYTLLLAVIYALIPYKTPWCMLGFFHGMILMAGVGIAVAVWRAPFWWMRFAMAGAVAVAVVHLGQQAVRATTAAFDADTRNPYVYAQATRDAARLGQRVEALAACHEAGARMTVKVVADEYWPLPWYLRRLENVGYWNAVPEDPDAPVLAVSPVLEKEVDNRLAGRYHKEFYSIRPEVLVVLYVDETLWSGYLSAQSRR